MIGRRATFDEYAAAIDEFVRGWLFPLTVSEISAEFGFSYRVTEAAIVHRAGISIGDGDVVLRGVA